MKLDKALRRERRQRKAKARRTLRVHSRAIAPMQSRATQDAALALAHTIKPALDGRQQENNDGKQ